MSNLIDMNTSAFGYCLSALLMVIVCIIVFITFEKSYKSRARNIFIWILLFIVSRVFGNLLQAIFTDESQKIIATIGIYIGIFSSILIFFSITMFLHLILGEHQFKRPFLFISVSLLFGVLICTINPATFSVTYDLTLHAYTGKGDIIHTILSLLAPFIVNTAFLTFLIKQYEIVEKSYHKSVSLMIAGVILMGYVPLIFYIIRYVFFPIQNLLHVENVVLGFGSIFTTIGFLLGGKISLLGSSKIFYVSIFHKSGLNVYHGIYSGDKQVDEQLLSALATAITSFANLVIGENVFPNEIVYRDFAVLLYRYKDVVGFISCKYPSRQLRFGLKSIVEKYEEEMSKDDITKLLEENLPYGKPIEIK